MRSMKSTKGKRRRPGIRLFLSILWNVLKRSIATLIFVIIPGLIAIYQFSSTPDKAVIGTVPGWFWLTLMAIGVAYILYTASKIYKVQAAIYTRRVKKKSRKPSVSVVQKTENNVNSPQIKAEGSGIASGRDTHVTKIEHHYHPVEKKQGVDYPKVGIENVPDVLKHSATIRIINQEYRDLEDLRVELKKLYGIFNGVKADAYPFNPSTSGFDCGDRKVEYGGSKDVQIASNADHNLTFLTSSPIQPQTYYTDGQRDMVTYEFEVWVHGKLDGSPITPPLQFCGRIDFWRAYQSHDVETSEGIKHYEGQISQVEMKEIECENPVRWWTIG
jgi:hypothetical protein